MKKFYIILIALFVVNGAMGQSCLPQGITFNTQAQIDNFQINYPNCTQIEGIVTIIGSNITNLNGLSDVTSIGGNLIIGRYSGGNPALTSLTGLESLTSIGGLLLIEDNYTLTSLTGLDNVTSIGEDLQIFFNNALTSLTGLESLSSIGHSLLISNNIALTSLTGLEGLTTIGTNLYIGGNNTTISLTGLDNVTSIGGNLELRYLALTSMTGLDNVTSVGGHLSIYHNFALTSLTGLESLTSIGGDLLIEGNGALTILTGLESLTSIGESIKIEGNGALTNLTGLDNIDAGSFYFLYIFNNPLLSYCEVQSICDFLSSPFAICQFYNNAIGCNSTTEVVAACEAMSVEGLNQSGRFSMYPNPSSDYITIETSAIPTKSQLSIMNLNGQHLITLQITEPKTQLDISTLPNGVYFVQLTGERTVEVRKFVKQ
jgi:acyl-[acyl carrier protein]--UDP-N-acetylglucosamine O-acyltransferase